MSIEDKGAESSLTSEFEMSSAMVRQERRTFAISQIKNAEGF